MNENGTYFLNSNFDEFKISLLCGTTKTLKKSTVFMMSRIFISSNNSEKVLKK